MLSSPFYLSNPGYKILESNEYPCKPSFYHMKVGCKGVYIIRTCLHDAFE